MRNFIKYSKFRLRDRPESCSPVGPNFSSARLHSVHLAGTHIQFKAPSHDPSPYGRVRQVRMKKAYSLSHSRVLNWNLQPSQSWKSTKIFFREWSFCGPWFTGFMGDTSCYLEAIQLNEPNPNVNFMHPHALETAALAFLTAKIGRASCRERV